MNDNVFVRAARDLAQLSGPPPIDDALVLAIAERGGFSICRAERRELDILQTEWQRFYDELLSVCDPRTAHNKAIAAARERFKNGEAIGAIADLQAQKRESEARQAVLRQIATAAAPKAIAVCEPILRRFARCADDLADKLLVNGPGEWQAFVGSEALAEAAERVRWQGRHLLRRVEDRVPHWSCSVKRLLEPLYP